VTGALAQIIEQAGSLAGVARRALAPQLESGSGRADGGAATGHADAHPSSAVAPRTRRGPNPAAAAGPSAGSSAGPLRLGARLPGRPGRAPKETTAPADPGSSGRGGGPTTANRSPGITTAEPRRPKMAAVRVWRCRRTVPCCRTIRNGARRLAGPASDDGGDPRRPGGRRARGAPRRGLSPAARRGGHPGRGVRAHRRRAHPDRRARDARHRPDERPPPGPPDRRDERAPGPEVTDRQGSRRASPDRRGPRSRVLDGASPDPCSAWCTSATRPTITSIGGPGPRDGSRSSSRGWARNGPTWSGTWPGSSRINGAAGGNGIPAHIRVPASHLDEALERHIEAIERVDPGRARALRETCSSVCASDARTS